MKYKEEQAALFTITDTSSSNSLQAQTSSHVTSQSVQHQTKESSQRRSRMFSIGLRKSINIARIESLSMGAKSTKKKDTMKVMRVIISFTRIWFYGTSMKPRELDNISITETKGKLKISSLSNNSKTMVLTISFSKKPNQRLLRSSIWKEDFSNNKTKSKSCKTTSFNHCLSKISSKRWYPTIWRSSV